MTVTQLYRHVKKNAWAITALLFALSWAHWIWKYENLKTTNKLLWKLTAQQDEWCSGVRAVNDVCEETLYDISIRLGLDNDLMPLVTTALWKRTARGRSVSEARRLLGDKAAKELDAPDTDAAIGGPEEDN